MAAISYFRQLILAARRNVQRTTRRDVFESHGPPLVSHDGASPLHHHTAGTSPPRSPAISGSRGGLRLQNPDSGSFWTTTRLTVCPASWPLWPCHEQHRIAKRRARKQAACCAPRTTKPEMPQRPSKSGAKPPQTSPLAASPAKRPSWQATNALRPNCTLMAIRPAPDSSVPGLRHPSNHPLDWRAVRGNKQSGMPRVPLPAVTSRIGWAVDKAQQPESRDACYYRPINCVPGPLLSYLPCPGPDSSIFCLSPPCDVSSGWMIGVTIAGPRLVLELLQVAGRRGMAQPPITQIWFCLASFPKVRAGSQEVLAKTPPWAVEAPSHPSV